MGKIPNAACRLCTCKIKCKMGRNDKELSVQGRICCGGITIYLVMQFTKRVFPFIHTHTLVHIKNERKRSLSIFLSELKCQVESL